MYQVGLTGGIGSGKTLVCSVLEKLGIPVYYADREARRLMNDDPDLNSEIVKLLGDQSYRDGVLDRAFVAERVFTDPALLDSMNSMVHPAVRKDYLAWVAKQEAVPYVVEEAAILFESGSSEFMDWTVMVYAPEELRIGRVSLRDRIGEADVRRRMDRQMDEEKKRELADEVILNDEKVLLLPQIIDMHRRIINRI